MSPFHNGDEGSPAESPQLDSLSLNILGDLLKDLGQLGDDEDDACRPIMPERSAPVDIMMPQMVGPPPTTVHPREPSAGSGSSAEGHIGVPVFAGGRWGTEATRDEGSHRGTPPTPPTAKKVMSNGEADPNDDRPKGAPAVDLAKFRTKVCKNYSTGQPCQFGDRCAFAHGLYQVRSNLDPNPVLQVYGPQGKKKQQEAKKQAQAAQVVAQQQAQLLQQAQLQQLQTQLVRPGVMPGLGGFGLNPALPFSSVAGLHLPAVGQQPQSAPSSAASADDKQFIDGSGCTWFV